MINDAPNPMPDDTLDRLFSGRAVRRDDLVEAVHGLGGLTRQEAAAEVDEVMAAGLFVVDEDATTPQWPTGTDGEAD